eukprot:g75.t1
MEIVSPSHHLTMSDDMTPSPSPTPLQVDDLLMEIALPTFAAHSRRRSIRPPYNKPHSTKTLPPPDTHRANGDSSTDLGAGSKKDLETGSKKSLHPRSKRNLMSKSKMNVGQPDSTPSSLTNMAAIRSSSSNKHVVEDSGSSSRVLANTGSATQLPTHSPVLAAKTSSPSSRASGRVLTAALSQHNFNEGVEEQQHSAKDVTADAMGTPVRLGPVGAVTTFHSSPRQSKEDGPTPDVGVRRAFSFRGPERSLGTSSARVMNGTNTPSSHALNHHAASSPSHGHATGSSNPYYTGSPTKTPSSPQQRRGWFGGRVRTQTSPDEKADHSPLLDRKGTKSQSSPNLFKTLGSPIVRKSPRISGSPSKSPRTSDGNPGSPVLGPRGSSKTKSNRVLLAASQSAIVLPVIDNDNVTSLSAIIKDKSPADTTHTQRFSEPSPRFQPAGIMDYRNLIQQQQQQQTSQPSTTSTS